jgi:hypothetical protein
MQTVYRKQSQPFAIPVRTAMVLDRNVEQREGELS